MEVAAYARISTMGQIDGYSLAVQVSQCTDAAASDGYEIAPERVFEEVYSGAELWDRPVLTKLRETLILTRSIEALYVHSVDRLARDPVHLLILLEEADRHGVAIRFVTEPLDDSDEGRLVQYVRGYAAKIEREKIRERTLRGKLAKVMSGKILGCGRSLYGYFTANGVRTIDETQALVVRQIYEWAGEGVAIREVARRLTAEGVPSPTGNEHWAKSTVSRILHESSYRGSAYAWRWKREGKMLVERDREEWIAIPPSASPAIVDQKLWSAVQERLVRNKQLASRNASNPERFLLRGYVRCGNCGFPMWTDSRRHGEKNVVAYRCRGSAAHRQSTCEAGSRPSISAEKLDRWVWHQVSAVLSDPVVVKREVERLRRQPFDEVGRRRRYEKALSKSRTRREGLIAALAELGDRDGKDVELVRLDLLDELRSLRIEEQRLEDECEKEKERGRRQRLAAENLARTADWCREVLSRLGSFRYNEKRLALEAVGAEVLVYPSSHTPRAELVLSMPGKSSSVVLDTTS